MPANSVQCKVNELRYITPTVFELLFESEPGFDFKAGQFISIVVPGAGPNGRNLRRAYSIASAPGVNPVELCIKVVEGGPGTTYLKNLKKDELFQGFAPYGSFTYVTPPSRHVVFLATGTGIAPFRSMILSKHYQEARPLSTTCVYGCRFEDELLYGEEFLANEVKLIQTVSRPKGNWSGITGRCTDYLRSVGNDFPWLETDFYLCGNGDMITEVKSILAEKNVTKEAIFQEKYY